MKQAKESLDLNLKQTAHQSLKIVNPINTVYPISNVSQLPKTPLQFRFSYKQQIKTHRTLILSLPRWLSQVRAS